MSSPALLAIFGVDPKRIGGIEVQAHELAGQLAAHGWRTILCFLREPPEGVRRYLAAPHVSLETLPEAFCNSRAAVSGLARLLRSHRPQVVHLQFTPLLSPLPWLARAFGAEKVFFTDHGSRPEGYEPHAKPPWKRWAASLMSLPLTGVIGVSDYNRRALTEEGLIRPSCIHRIYNGIEIARAREDGRGAEFRRRYAIPLDRILVTQTSWLIPEKGITDLLDAARLALNEEPALHFAFIGEGAFGQQYAARARDMGLGDRLTWTGLVRDPIGESAFAAADIVCQMSRWEEAFGMVIAEAMAFSKPVVATCVGGIPEVVHDGETGFLVPRGDSAAAARRIVQLARDPELRIRMGGAGRRLAEAQFDVRENAAAILRLYGIA